MKWSTGYFGLSRKVSTMKAVRYYDYGPPDVVRVEDVKMPVLGDQDVLIRVRAAAVNPLDWHFMRGMPYLVRAQGGLRRPKFPGLGADMAGHVEAVGKDVTKFKPGDAVFGGGRGTLAEYISVPEDGVLIAKPASLSFEQAGAVGVAAFTALQALRDKGHVAPGQNVLVNGASGGVGTFTVQIAKAFGATVTGVCSTGNMEMVRSIGAEHVVDYTEQDFTQTTQRYDLMIDIAGGRTAAECRRVLTQKGTLVAVGGPDNGNWIGPLTGLGKTLALGLVVSQKMTAFLAQQNVEDLPVLRDLLDEGKVTPVIDRTYPLDDAAEAIRYLEKGHARGKVVVTI